MRRRNVSLGGDIARAGRIAAACAALFALAQAAPALGATPHVVQPGESLWSIAAANNFTTRTVAVFNGLAEDAMVVAGQTIQIPTVAEGEAALANAGVTPSTSSGSSGSGVAHTVAPGESLSSVAAANGITIDALASANGLANDAFLIAGDTITIPAVSSSTAATGAGGSTYGLTPAAASAWEQMRQASLATFGIDLYPAGPLSAYRTYEQQAYLYQLYLDGVGAPANPPGTSTHELGIAVDLLDPAMRSVVDQIGATYCWVGNIPSEWWHVAYLC